MICYDIFPKHVASIRIGDEAKDVVDTPEALRKRKEEEPPFIYYEIDPEDEDDDFSF